MTVCLEADGKAYTIPVMYKDLAVISPEKLDRNGSFKTGDCTVHIKSYDSAARIQPENAGKEYNYYEVSDEANILFIVNTEISNNSQKKVYVDDVMSLCITDGYDRYFATAVLENEDKTDYLVDQVTEILPRRTIQVSYVIDVPFSVVKEDLMLEIFSYGKRYRLFY